VNQNIFFNEKRNDCDKFIIFKREVISPAWLESVHETCTYVVEGTKMMIHAKKNDDFFFWGGEHGGISSHMSSKNYAQTVLDLKR
jgi:hypothetical protein